MPAQRLDCGGALFAQILSFFTLIAQILPFLPFSSSFGIFTIFNYFLPFLPRFALYFTFNTDSLFYTLRPDSVFLTIFALNFFAKIPSFFTFSPRFDHTSRFAIFTLFAHIRTLHPFRPVSLHFTFEACGIWRCFMSQL